MAELLALDLGTEGLRCFVFNSSGGLLASCRRPFKHSVPPESPWGREFDPGQLWGSVCSAVKEALSRAGVGGISGIAVTAHRGGMAFLDRDGGEVYLGPNLDLRAAAEGMEIDSGLGERVYAITGHLPSVLFAPARLLWLRRHRPQDYERVACVLDLGGWLVYRLTGERAVERAAAVELGLAGVGSGEWSGELVALLGLPSGVYPPQLQAGEVFGVLSPEAARELGLAPGIPVTCGGPDTQCGLAGLGVEEGEVGIIVGWSAPVQTPLGHPLFDPGYRTWTGRHILPGKWVLEANCGEAGEVYRRAGEWLFGGAGFEEVEKFLSGVSSGPGSVLAFLGPGLKDLRRPGARAGGFLFPLPLFLPDIGAGEIMMAVVENIGFALREAVEYLEKLCGAVYRVRVGGGMARSRRFLQTLADILGRPIEAVPGGEVSGLGAAACAAVAAGLYPGPEEALKAMAFPAETIEPGPVSSSEYEELYHRWRRFDAKLEELRDLVL